MLRAAIRKLLSFAQWRQLTEADKLELEGRDAFNPDDPGVDVDLPREIDHGLGDLSRPERGWMQTYQGERFYPLAPAIADVDVLDIGMALGNICRFNGHVKNFYSVAEHCVHVSRQVELRMRNVETRARKYDEATIRRWSMRALLHDAAEAYIGDMVRPLKHQPEMVAFRDAEDRLLEVVLAAIGIPMLCAEDEREADMLIKEIDDRILADEAERLKRGERWWSKVPPLGVRIECWGPSWASERFLLRYEGLEIAQ